MMRSLSSGVALPLTTNVHLRSQSWPTGTTSLPALASVFSVSFLSGTIIAPPPSPRSAQGLSGSTSMLIWASVTTVAARSTQSLA